MPESLRHVQRWVQGAIVSGEGLERANRLVKPSWSLAPEERIRIYAGMYPLRMRDALAADYPGLLRGLGERRFEELVRDYVAVHPSRSYTLNRLGDRLPEFLRSAPGQVDRAFWADLARLERMITEAFDAFEDAAPVTTSLSGASHVPVTATLRLGAFRYPAGDYLDALRSRKRRPPVPGRRATWIAVYRREDEVRRLDLTAPAFDLLSALSRGRSLGSALRAARRRHPRSFHEHAVARLFRRLTASGILRAGPA